jgi:uncharacterized NAD-dependent epimerase/dehydratase family protein
MERLPSAIILTNGLLKQHDAKTAHGLIRGTDRFKIIAVIDSNYKGCDAGWVLDGKIRGIPIYGSIEEAFMHCSKIDYCIIGIATVGGILPKSFYPILKTCLLNRISIVNGLHEFLSENTELKELATKNAVKIIDVRKPKNRQDYHFWTGEIFSTKAIIIGVLGTDCAIGKRTTARLLTESCIQAGLNAQMIYTGQTGWMQGVKFGFILDSTPNDFISGELEFEILSCIKQTNADVIIIEGQSALRNPSGPCGSEILLSANAKHIILVYSPKRKFYDDNPKWGKIPTLASELNLINNYGSSVLSIVLNTENCSTKEASDYQIQIENEFKIPVILPFENGTGKIVPSIKKLFIQK